ncbi:MAG: peroxidase-related enzyme [Gammaproteobacteria bacterium]
MPQPPHISRLPVPAIDTLDPDLQKYLGICQKKLGLVPNVLRAYALRPARLRNFISVYNELMLGEDSGLSTLEREMIAVVVSSANRCYYCLVAHGQAVRELSGDPQLGEMLVMNYRVAPLPDRHRTMLDFAHRLTTAPNESFDGERQALRENGFSDADIFDISETAAFFNYTNRMAVALDMMPNPEYHAMHRQPAP